MKVDVTLGAEFWRAVAKVACNMLALERRDLFLDPVFDPVRSFVLKGGDDTWSFVSLNCEPLLVGQSLGDLDHLVVVRGERKTGEVRALVVFYGYLEFVVRVGSTRIAEDFSTAYRVNQIAHTDRRDAPEDTAIAVPPFEPLTMASEARWGAAYQLAISNAMLDAHRVADKRAIAHVAQLVAQDFRAGVTWVSDVAMQDSMLRHLDEHYPVLAERWRARRPK